MPHLMNCPHSEAGWCLDCVVEQHAMLERMDAELRNERDSRSVLQRALILAAFLPSNQDKSAGFVRDAAVTLFGQEAVDAAVNFKTPNV
jgi:hypothetical protein